MLRSVICKKSCSETIKILFHKVLVQECQSVQKRPGDVSILHLCDLVRSTRNADDFWFEHPVLQLLL
jgi:hypothetical protein